MSICSIDDRTESNLMVIWDLGRRCTYECSYCPPHRRNNWSPIASLDELVSTAVELERYNNTYNQYRNAPFKVNASFSGGEPTVNPAFFEFLEVLQRDYPHWKRTLTTNGFYTERRLRTVMESTDFTTVSYHCEATPNQKQRVRENMRVMHDENYGFKVNVMFHENPEYFKECIDLCAWFDDVGIKYTPRVIGDQGDIKLGLKDGTVHTYDDWQIEWFKNFWKVKNNNTLKDNNKTIGQSIGRPCCGGRNLHVTDEAGVVSESKFVIDNNFEGWNCMVNWYFLYIHQEINQIWHHQTCQVNLEGNVAPISTVAEFSQYNDNLATQLSSGSFPYIKCPKTHCGCGLCVPKAKSIESSNLLFNSHTRGVIPIYSDRKTSPSSSGSLKAMVNQFDRKYNGNK